MEARTAKVVLSVSCLDESSALVDHFEHVLLEFVVRDESVLVLVDLSHDIFPEVSLAVSSSLICEHFLKLLGADGTISVCVKHIEGATNVIF